jgi:hypothetical protein
MAVHLAAASGEPSFEAMTAQFTQLHADTIGAGLLRSCELHGLVVTLVTLLQDVLSLHAPRRSTMPGIAPRCQHDGKTWPCRTVTLLRAVLQRHTSSEGDRAGWQGGAS